MIRKPCLLPLVVLYFVLSGCFNQKKPVLLIMDKDCLPIIEQFYSNVNIGKPGDGLEKLLKLNPNINIGDSSVILLKKKLDEIGRYSGQFLGYKILKKREVLSDISIYSCLTKYEKKFYRFIFIFYQPIDKPTIYKFMIDDGIEVEIEESLKFYSESN